MVWQTHACRRLALFNSFQDLPKWAAMLSIRLMPKFSSPAACQSECTLGWPVPNSYSRLGSHAC